MDHAEEKSSITEKKRKAYSRRRKKRRNDLIKKAIVLAVIILVVIFGVRFIQSAKNKQKTTSEDGRTLVETQLSQITHLSFEVLSIEESEERMSLAEFEDALQKLYDEGYCLMDVYDIVDTDTEGGYTYKETFLFPEGKKPLLLSQRDVCYPFDAAKEGVAEKMLLQDGKIACQYTDSSGNTQTGDFDLVPILESFLEEHPDFSYNGARGILSFSGYCGILGYRSSSYLAAEENNPYAESYGTFDTSKESKSAKEVLEALSQKGWHFASNGFAKDISYGSEYSIVEEDAQSWENEVKSIIGDTDIILLPRETDIGSWKGYTEENSKYTLLKEKGFSFFFVGEQSTPYLLQVKSDYVRQTVFEINNNGDFASLFADAQSVQEQTEEENIQESSSESSQSSLSETVEE